MTDMIEKVARAINPRAWDDDHWAIVGAREEQLSAQSTAFHRARAAIKAMREVDQHALWTFVIGPHYRHVSNDPHLESRGLTIEEGWHALIDAALTDARGS